MKGGWALFGLHLESGVGTGADAVHILSGIRDVCHVVRLQGGNSLRFNVDLAPMCWQFFLHASRLKPFGEL